MNPESKDGNNVHDVYDNQFAYGKMYIELESHCTKSHSTIRLRVLHAQVKESESPSKNLEK